MEMKNSFVESVTNQYISDLCNDIPNIVKEKCKNPNINIDLEKEVSAVVTKSLIKTTGVGYDVPSVPEGTSIDKQRHRRSYQKKIFIEEIEEDYRQALSGNIVIKLYSPFAENVIMDRMRTCGSREASIESIYRSESDGIQEYLKRLGRNLSVRSGMANFTGFTEYKNFDLLASCEKEKAKKYVLLDIEDCLFRLSFSEKYVQYAQYLPEKIAKGFYFENAKRTKDIEEDAELRDMGEDYVHKMFFPEIVRPVSVSIVSQVPWDYEDRAILSYVITKALKESVKNGGALRAEGGYTEIATKVLGRTRQKIGSRTIRKRLENIFATRLVAECADHTEMKMIFEHSTLGNENDGKDAEGFEAKAKNEELRWKAVFGAGISADIISSRVYLSVKPQLDKLEHVVSKALYHVLRKDRAMDFVLVGRGSHVYSYNDLRFIFRVKESQKAKAVARYKAAFEEMKEKEILIKDYFYDDESKQFMVDWLELTEEEGKDIRLLGQNDFLEGED